MMSNSNNEKPSAGRTLGLMIFMIIAFTVSGIIFAMVMASTRENMVLGFTAFLISVGIFVGIGKAIGVL
jgi:hypothetical protein